MDLAYWGFRRWPFERSFAADRFFATPLHEEALARLLFLVEEKRRAGIVSGPQGTGKSFLFRLLQQRAERLGRLAIRCEAFDGNDLVNQVAAGCHAPCDADATSMRLWSALQARFAGLALIKQHLLLLIEHVDLSDSSCQRAICRLHQLADSSGTRMTVVLSTRERTVPAVLQGDIELRIDLESWTSDETSQFVNWSVAGAGCSRALFTESAMAAIHRSTSGIPADVTVLSSMAMLIARAQDEKLVTPDFVELAADEFRPRFVDRRENARPFIEHSPVVEWAR